MALTDTFVKQVKHKKAASGDKYADGHGLHLLVKEAGKYWRVNYRYLGKHKTLSLGTYPDTSLAQARIQRDHARKLLAQGTDPSAAKQDAAQAERAAAGSTFESVAREWLKKTSANRMTSTDEKVTNWLNNDVLPVIGAMPISKITTRDVLTKVLQKIEARGAIDTAHRIKQLIGQVFSFAVVNGLADRDVTKELKGALTVASKANRPAITEVKPFGDLMRSIHSYSGYPVTIAALKILPLVFVRPAELRTAEWAEIDFTTNEWRIPAAKMKMKIDHIVPLSRQALEILQSIKPLTGHGQYVFPSLRTGERPMSDNTINAALRGMGIAQEVHCAHGFRASARTIMDEVLGEPPHLIEHQLAHAVKDVNGRAYNRTSHLPARREMMQRWADYLDKLRMGAEVIRLHGAA